MMSISYSVLCAKNYESWLAIDKVVAVTNRLSFLAHPDPVLYIHIVARDIFLTG